MNEIKEAVGMVLAAQVKILDALDRAPRSNDDLSDNGSGNGNGGGNGKKRDRGGGSESHSDGRRRYDVPLERRDSSPISTSSQPPPATLDKVGQRLRASRAASSAFSSATATTATTAASGSSLQQRRATSIGTRDSGTRDSRDSRDSPEDSPLAAGLLQGRGASHVNSTRRPTHQSFTSSPSPAVVPSRRVSEPQPPNGRVSSSLPRNF